jgi:hypothetical protein
MPTAFDGSGSSDVDGTVSRYDWDFGDGTSLADGGPSPAHTYAVPGNYTATLIVTDNEGCSTQFVFTGQTASCNAGSSARAQHDVVVGEAPPSADTDPPDLVLGGHKKQKLHGLRRGMQRRRSRHAHRQGPDPGRRQVIVGP